MKPKLSLIEAIVLIEQLLEKKRVTEIKQTDLEGFMFEYKLEGSEEAVQLNVLEQTEFISIDKLGGPILPIRYIHNRD